MKKMVVAAEQIQALTERSADAYSADAYTSWKACAAALLRRGYTDRQAEEILRSKITRWAADSASKGEGRTTANDLLRFMDRCPDHTIAVLYEAGLHTLTDEEWAVYHGIRDNDPKSPRRYKRHEVLDLVVEAALSRAPDRVALDRLRKLPSAAEVQVVVGSALNIILANRKSFKQVDWFVADVADEALDIIGRQQPRKRSRRAS